MSPEIEQLKKVFDSEAKQLAKLQKILTGLNEIVSTYSSHSEAAETLLDFLGTEARTLQHIKAWGFMIDQMLTTWAMCVRLEAFERRPVPSPGSN